MAVIVAGGSGDARPRASAEPVAAQDANAESDAEEAEHKGEEHGGIDGADDVRDRRMTDVGGEPRPFRLDRQDGGQGDAGDPGDGHGARAEFCALGGEGGEHQQDRPQQTDRRPGAIEQKIGWRGAVGLGRQHLAPPKIAAEVKREPEQPDRPELDDELEDDAADVVGGAGDHRRLLGRGGRFGRSRRVGLADPSHRPAVFSGEGGGVIVEGQALPMEQHLRPAKPRFAQLGLERGGGRSGQGEHKRLAAGVAGLGFAVEGAAAGDAPLFDPLGAAGVGGDLHEGAIEHGGIDAEQSGLVHQPASFDQPSGAGLAFSLTKAVFFHLQAGSLLLEPDLTFCKGGSSHRFLRSSPFADAPGDFGRWIRFGPVSLFGVGMRPFGGDAGAGFSLCLNGRFDHPTYCAAEAGDVLSCGKIQR